MSVVQLCINIYVFRFQINRTNTKAKLASWQSLPMASAAANKVPMYILTLMLLICYYRGQKREDELCIVM